MLATFAVLNSAVLPTCFSSSISQMITADPSVRNGIRPESCSSDTQSNDLQGFFPPLFNTCLSWSTEKALESCPSAGGSAGMFWLWDAVLCFGDNTAQETALTATAHLNALVAATGNAISQCCPSLFSITPVFKEQEALFPLLQRLVQARLTGMWRFLRDVVKDKVNIGALVTPQKSDCLRLSWKRAPGKQQCFSSLPLGSWWDC